MAASRKIELLYEPVPSPGNIKIGAAIRATVLLALSLWLYSVMQASDMMLSLVAGALSTQDPGYATFTWIVLTMGGCSLLLM